MAERNLKWYKLDNAATVIPSVAKGADTRVFRIVCELKEDVCPKTLQDALDLSIDEFPHLNVVLRKGLFWYYLDSTSLRPKVTEDTNVECSPLYFPGRHSLLYRVTYFHKRINLEMFHVLADGAGALVFLKSLVGNYLKIAHHLDMEIEHETKSTTHQKSDDAFRQFYISEKSGEELPMKRAFQIKQYRGDSLSNRLVEGCISSSKFMQLAKDNDTTAGVLSVSLFIESVIETMSKEAQKRPIIMNVPVNLRQFFSSDTTRNFFGVIYVKFDPKDYDGTLKSITETVKTQFKEQLVEENIRKTMNGFSSMQRNLILKMVPLILKEPVILLTSTLVKRGVTATISNLGRIEMPKELAPYIDSFGAFMSTPNMQITISSFGDKMVFGVVSARLEYNVIAHFFRKLSSYGLDVIIASNDHDFKPNKKAEKHLGKAED